MMDFPPHQRPNVSRLEIFRSEIAAMRASNWPFQKISAWLAYQHQIIISKEAVRQFCKIRRIGNTTSDILSNSCPAATCIHEKLSSKFEFDDSLPIKTRKNLKL